jgi:anti-sigma-K factor RskA
MTVIGPDDDTTLAAEYSLGLLEGQARARAAERLRTDDAFRAEVEAWQRRFASLFDEVAPRDPPADLWRRIAGALEGRDNVVPLPIRPRLWNRAGPWQAATAGSLAAAAALTFFAIHPARAPAPVPPTSAPLLTATMAAPDGKILYVATIDRSRAGVTVVPVSGVERKGRTAELWIVPVGGKPRAVGLLAGQSAVSVPASSSVVSAAQPKAVLAVSLEPLGGSPTGAPTGPIIASGVARLL